MKCRTCGQTMTAYAEGEMRDHHLQQMPFGGRCLGCFAFAVELDTFLIRSDRPFIMGDWEDGWMKAIIADPKKFLDGGE